MYIPTVWCPSICPVQCSCLYDSQNERKVDCNNRSLNEVPNDIPSDTQILDLANNQIEILYSFPQLSNLNTLDIGYNPLAKILPGAFDKLIGLTTLNLNNTEISSLPRNIFTKLSTLTEIWLEGNNLTCCSNMTLSIDEGLENQKFHGHCKQKDGKKYELGKLKDGKMRFIISVF